ncbi:Histone acetyltransferase type B catalytic subunit [Nymphon striatum]|nr:Histone acetyltransferase type B catalytic subunit [Nymphon striatum]
MSIARDALAPYVCSTNDAITFKLVRDVSDIGDEKKSFHPEFTHQLFGDNESIFGYRDLSIMLYYSAGRLTTYLNMSYKDKVNPKDFDGVEADEVMSIIAEKLQPGFISNIDDFSSSLDKDKSFRPHGELIHSFTQPKTTDKDCKNATYEIYKADVSVPGFKDYHERLQTFVLWYIDAASFIDIDDERWSFFVLYEKYKSDSGSMYAIIGYATVYAYYAYPQNLRPRISQLLVFPPFQKNGLGVELLQSIYNSYIGNPDIIDITVEDPSDNFIRLRDYVDVKNCLKLKAFSKEKLLIGFSADMVNEGKKKFKLNKVVQAKKKNKLWRGRIVGYKLQQFNEIRDGEFGKSGSFEI